MKLLIFFSLPMIALSIPYNCSEVLSSRWLCRQIAIKADEPIARNNFSATMLYLYDVNGSIGLKTLSTISALEELKIAESNIYSVENGAICSVPKLKMIDIDSNQHFPTLTQTLFTNCDQVEYMSLGQVNLESTALHNFLNLKSVSFTGLHVARFPKEFLRPLSRLKKLYIGSSDINEIESGSLCSSSSLEIIEIAYNMYFAYISKEKFDNCNTVKEFKYAHNPLFALEERTFSGFVNLKKATINNARIVHLTKAHLEGLSNLEYLEVEDCDITTIDRDAFEGFVKLKRLYLKSNKLREIDSFTLSHLTSLIHLSLYGNNIERIDNFTHPNLEIMNVINNKVPAIDPETVKLNLPKLKYMYADGNNMTQEYINDLKIKFTSLNISYVSFLLWNNVN